MGEPSRITTFPMPESETSQVKSEPSLDVKKNEELKALFGIIFQDIRELARARSSQNESRDSAA